MSNYFFMKLFCSHGWFEFCVPSCVMNYGFVREWATHSVIPLIFAKYAWTSGNLFFMVILCSDMIIVLRIVVVINNELKVKFGGFKRISSIVATNSWFSPLRASNARLLGADQPITGISIHCFSFRIFDLNWVNWVINC